MSSQSRDTSSPNKEPFSPESPTPRGKMDHDALNDMKGKSQGEEEEEEELRGLLLLCFPDVPPKELDEALAMAKGDPEVAVDHLLNLAFLADESYSEPFSADEDDQEGERIQDEKTRIDDGGEGGKNGGMDMDREFPALPSSTSQPDPDLDLAIALSLANVEDQPEGPQPTSAPGLSSQQHSGPSSRTPSTVITPSMRGMTGAWKDKEALIQQLSHAFPSFRRSQVAEAVREAQGNVDMAIDIIESSPLPWREEHDAALTRLSSIFPEHEVEKLAALVGSLPPEEIQMDRMVDAVLNGQMEPPQTKVSESMDFWMACRCQRESTSTSRSKGKSTGIQPRSLPPPPSPSTNKVIPFTKSTSKQGAWKVHVGRTMAQKTHAQEGRVGEEDREYNVEECRRQASLAASRRNQAYRAAARAFRSTPGGSRMKEAASYYASEARKHDANVRKWHTMATRVILDQQSPHPNIQDQGMDVIRVDLHGLTIPEACASALTAVNTWWDRECARRSVRRPRPLRLITGLGKHSTGGRSRLQPAVEAALRRDGWVSRREGGAILLEGSMQTG